MLVDRQIPAEPTHVTNIKRVRTVIMVASWIAMGFYSEITGPTLPVLKFLVNSNYEQIARALVARSVGFLLGTVTGGVLSDRLFRMTEAVTAVSLVVAGLSATAVPWSVNLVMLAALTFIDGLAKGILAVCSNNFMLKIWGGERASVPVHALHFAFGVGAMIVPQITRPFLPEHIPGVNGTQEADTTNLTGFTGLNNTSSAEEIKHNIRYPYVIVGGVTVLVGIVTCVAFVCLPKPVDVTIEEVDEKGSKTNKPSIWSMLSPTSCFPGQSFIYAVLILIMLFFLYGLPIGAERAYGKFLFPFATESALKMTKDAGATLETVFWITFTAGRGLVTIAAKWVPATQLLVVELVVGLASTITLALGGERHIIVIWVGTAVYASVMSPVFPSAMIWASTHMELSAMATSLAFICTAVNAIFFSWFAGYLFEYQGPASLMWLMLCNAITAFLMFIFLFLIVRRKSGGAAFTEKDTTHIPLKGPQSDTVPDESLHT